LRICAFAPLRPPLPRLPCSNRYGVEPVLLPHRVHGVGEDLALAVPEEIEGELARVGLQAGELGAEEAQAHPPGVEGAEELQAAASSIG